jgi:hypothetical protein
MVIKTMTMLHSPAFAIFRNEDSTLRAEPIRYLPSAGYHEKKLMSKDGIIPLDSALYLAPGDSAELVFEWRKLLILKVMEQYGNKNFPGLYKKYLDSLFSRQTCLGLVINENSSYQYIENRQ